MGTSQSSQILANVAPILYADVALDTVEQCTATLSMLRRRPDITRHVRKLVIRPRRAGFNGFDYKDSALVSAHVRDVAASGKLDALISFAWEDEELPYYDDMWFALRVWCVSEIGPNHTI